jgi:hypothetical protein
MVVEAKKNMGIQPANIWSPRNMRIESITIRVTLQTISTHWQNMLDLFLHTLFPLRILAWSRTSDAFYAKWTSKCDPCVTQMDVKVSKTSTLFLLKNGFNLYKMI